jgi:hypothetical protein
MALDSEILLHPRSRHNIHVRDRTDIEAVGPWSREELYSAVERADSEDGVVVLDYGREQLYLVDRDGLSFRPPDTLGIRDDPELAVADPAVFEPDSGTLRRPRATARVVSPEFDVLVPAFDWELVDEEFEPLDPQYRERPSDTPSGALGG